MNSRLPQPRSALTALPVYKPGKSAEVAMAEHQIASAIKLASNENPFDPLPSVRACLADASALLNRYPDHRATALREALASRHGLSAEQVAVGCGSVGLLQQILLSFVDPGDDVVYAWRSFEAYPIYTSVVGGNSVQVPLAGDAFDMAAIEAALTPRTKVVLITSPNNPTGTTVTHDEMVRLLVVAPAGCLVVLDEAYYEYITATDAPRALELLAEYPNLLVLRTFSKAYGLATLRVGYAFAHPEVIAAVDKTLIPFAVNGIGQAAALASLAAEGELTIRVAATLAERDRVVAALLAADHRVADAQANFVWMPVGAEAASLTLALESRGIVTRPFPGEGIRVTIGSPGENDLFLAALGAVVRV
jgi:histidinol-phosphate aminotransferase